MPRQSKNPELVEALKALGALIRDRRKALKFHRTKVAEAAGISDGELTAIEGGRVSASVSVLNSITIQLNTTVAVLLSQIPFFSSHTRSDRVGKRLVTGRALTREGVAKLDEAAFRRDVLTPLFRAMGLDFEETHGGILEQGKDFVIWSPSPMGDTQCIAVVVKAGDVSGSAESRPGTAATVATQIQQCLGRTWPHPLTGVQSPVGLCWVIASGAISKEARMSIESILGPSTFARVSLFSDDSLYALLEKHLAPSTSLGLLDEAATRLSGVAPEGLRVVAFAESDGRRGISLHPQPGTVAMDELQFGVTLSQPNTPEGHAKLKQAVDTLRFGGELSSADGVLSNFTPPAMIAQLIPAGQDLAQWSMLSRPHPVPIVVSLIALVDGTECARIEHLILNVVRTSTSGALRATTASEHEPLTVELVINDEAPGVTMSIVQGRLVDAVRALTALDFLAGSSTANQLRVLDERSETILLDGKCSLDGFHPVEPGVRDFLRRVASIQRFLKVHVPIATEDVGPSLHEAVIVLSELIEHGEFRAGVSDLRLEMRTLPEVVRYFLEMDDSAMPLVAPRRLEFSLGGRIIPVTVLETVSGMRLDDASRTALEQALRIGESHPHVPVSIRFVPREGTSFVLLRQVIEDAKVAE